MPDRDHLFSGEVRALAAAIALACLILAAVVLSNLGAFLVKRIVILAAMGAAAIALAGCAGFTVPGMSGGATAANSALNAFLTDPNCAHHDEANFVTGAGGVPASFSAKVMRDCPARAPAPAVLPAP